MKAGSSIPQRLAAQWLQDNCERQGIPMGQLTVHPDNGSPMKGETMPALTNPC